MVVDQVRESGNITGSELFNGFYENKKNKQNATIIDVKANEKEISFARASLLRQCACFSVLHIQ